ARFNAYREKLAEPTGAAFYACEHLLYLIDLSAILEGGPAVYHSTRQSIRQALEYLDPGHKSSQKIRDVTMNLITGGRWGSKISNIGFIATKADRVHNQDRASLLALLKEMTGDLIADAMSKRWLNVEYFYCAAVQATRDHDEYPYLEGYVPKTPEDPV